MGQNEHLTNDLKFSPSREGSSQWIGTVKWELGPNTKNTGIYLVIFFSSYCKRKPE